MAPPYAVFATSTARLSIAELANCTYRPEKCINLVLEAKSLSASLSRKILLRPTPVTASETIALLDDFWRRLSFTPAFERESAQSGLAELGPAQS